MNAALLLSAALAAAPATAAAPEPAAAPSASPAPAPYAAPAADAVPEKDRQPNAGTDGGATPFGLKSFDEAVKAELKSLEADAKETIRQIDAQYDAQKDMETRQLKEKFELLRRLRDERAAFERDTIDGWKKFVEKLRAVEPAERGTEKLIYDQKVMERRHKLDDEQTAKNKEFMDKQQRERDQFWTKLQQENNERARVQTEHATKWGKTPDAPR